MALGGCKVAEGDSRVHLEQVIGERALGQLGIMLTVVDREMHMKVSQVRKSTPT